jgi:hypothetical protein
MINLRSGRMILEVHDLDIEARAAAWPWATISARQPELALVKQGLTSSRPAVGALNRLELRAS